MKLGASHQVAAVDRPLVLRARADLQLAPVAFSSRMAYVLKDPLTLEMFQLSAEEFFLFEKLKRAISLKDLQQAFELRFAPRRITPQQIQEGVNNLHGQGLLLSEAAGQGSELIKRDHKRRRAERWQSLLKVLSFRLGSIDATNIVDSVYTRVRWLFSVPMMLCVVALLVYAVSLLVGHSREVVDRLPSLVELAQPRYWLMWLATITAVKVVHELAHAVTCKHFGGRCHEIGVLMLALVPCLYCDVSDVWRLPSKWQRIAVSAAGVIAELVIAALALTVWWHSAPGLLNTWCLSLVIVCSVGTLLVNLNPLLRYDGYYILSDLAEVPNLSSRSQQLLPTALRRWLFAEPRVADPMLSARQQKGLLLYCITARVYLTIVLLSIFVVLLSWARPYRLENLVYSLGAVTLAGMLFLPLAGVWRVVRNPSLRYRIRPPRLIGLVAAIAVLATAFFCWPFASSVEGPAVFVPAGAKPVYATTAGELQSARAAGTSVSAGEVIVQLADPLSEVQLARQQGELEVRRVRYHQLDAMRAWSDQSSEQLPTARAAMQDAAAQLAQLESTSEELTVRAPASGMVIAPPDRAQDQRDDVRLPSWTGSPLDERNQGCWIEAGTLLCLVGNPDELEALIMIDQTDVAEVEEGQSVEILLESSPVRVVTGEVVQVARRSLDRAAVDPAIDAGKYHLVQVRLDTADAPLLVGSRGTAKIKARRTTLSAMVYHQLQQMFRLPW